MRKMKKHHVSSAEALLLLIELTEKIIIGYIIGYNRFRVFNNIENKQFSNYL